MQSKSRTSNRRDLVLVGGGHAHVQVLQRFVMDPPPDVRLTLVVDQHEAVYSGMVPGVVAGDYEPDAVTIDLLPLARRAGARCIHAPATRIDPDARRIEVEGRPPIPYDVASIDVGSTIRAKALPGVREHAIPTRPIGQLIARIEQALERSAATGGKLRATLVGGGAAGTELAFCLEARLRASDRAHEITLITSAETPLDGASEAMQRRAMAALARRRINLLTETEVVSVGQATLEIVCGKDRSPDTLASGLTLWATGPAPHAFLADSPLPTADTGFVRVRSTFQVEGHDTLFAAGDCAVLIEHPWVPRAGVYAVRAGPLLDHNLRAALSGAALRTYTPQRDFLTLLNLGEREAIGGKWGVSFEGGWVWRMKDWIDRRFMRKFSDLPDMASDDKVDLPAGLADAQAIKEISAVAMRCGGCGAKVGATVLARVMNDLVPAPREDVLIGLHEPDDAAVVQVPPDKVVVHTVDSFRAMVDDPYLFGKIAANHSLGDIYAMGAEPQTALAIATLPYGLEDKVEDTLRQMMTGAMEILGDANAALVGGHTSEGAELSLGFSISGLIDRDAVMRKGGMRPGNALLVTKAIGTGTLFAADMRHAAKGAWISRALESMTQSNRLGAACLHRHGATACTDVTGFGLLGHLVEMIKASQVDVELDLGKIPYLEGALETVAKGITSSLQPQNLRLRRAVRDLERVAGDPRYPLLFDPQTAGGLLASVPVERVDECMTELHQLGYLRAAVIGAVLPESNQLEPVSLLI